jgi:hypothetical protein
MTDLFNKYTAGGFNPSQMEAFEELARRQFSGTTMGISEGSPFKEESATPQGTNEATWQEIASKYGHEYLPVTGGMAGSIIGGAGALIGGQLGPQIATPEEIATVPLAVSAGGAGGFALGEQAADVLDEMLGI